MTSLPGLNIVVPYLKVSLNPLQLPTVLHQPWQSSKRPCVVRVALEGHYHGQIQFPMIVEGKSLAYRIQHLIQTITPKSIVRTLANHTSNLLGSLGHDPPSERSGILTVSNVRPHAPLPKHLRLGNLQKSPHLQKLTPRSRPAKRQRMTQTVSFHPASQMLHSL